MRASRRWESLRATVEAVAIGLQGAAGLHEETGLVIAAELAADELMGGEQAAGGCPELVEGCGVAVECAEDRA